MIDNPFDKLLSARERGWKFGGVAGANYTRTGESYNDAAQRTVGFTFTADAHRSGKGIIGQIQAELYYVPAIKYHMNNGRVTTRTDNSGGSPINRFFTKPRLEGKNIIDLNSTSRKIAIAVLRYNLSHPFRG